MANIMDLFSPTEVVNVEFDVQKAMGIYERIRKAQDAVGGTPRLKAKIGGGGTKVFTMTFGNRDIVMEKFQGVIVSHHKSNALFKTEGDETENMNTPPICSSVDGMNGVVLETGECRNCETCPHNIFGTAEKGKGKACKNMHRLYILVEGSPIPVTLSIPPTSLELWRNYALMDIAASGLDICEVVTEFSLTNEVNESGIKYSIVNFKCVGKVNDEVKEFCVNMGSAIEDTPRLAIAADEYNREPAGVLQQADDEDVTEVEADEVIDEAPADNSSEEETEEVDLDTL